MGSITKKKLFAPKDRKTIKVMLSEYGEWEEDDYVLLRSLSAKELMNLSETFGKDVDESDSWGFVCKLLAKSLVNDKGELLLEGDEDIESLLGKSHALLKGLGDEAITLNGLDPDSDSKKN